MCSPTSGKDLLTSTDTAPHPSLLLTLPRVNHISDSGNCNTGFGDVSSKDYLSRTLRRREEDLLLLSRG